MTVVLCNAPLRSFVGLLWSFAVFSHTPLADQDQIGACRGAFDVIVMIPLHHLLLLQQVYPRLKASFATGSLQNIKLLTNKCL